MAHSKTKFLVPGKNLKTNYFFLKKGHQSFRYNHGGAHEIK